jgi:hypothetical protein
MYGQLTDPIIKDLADEWKELSPQIEKQLEELRDNG